MRYWWHLICKKLTQLPQIPSTAHKLRVLPERQENIFVWRGEINTFFLFNSRKRCHWQWSAATWWLRWTARRSEVASIHGVWQKVCPPRSFTKGRRQHLWLPSVLLHRAGGELQQQFAEMYLVQNCVQFARAPTWNTRVWRADNVQLHSLSALRVKKHVFPESVWCGACVTSPVFTECINYQRFNGIVKMYFQWGMAWNIFPHATKIGCSHLIVCNFILFLALGSLQKELCVFLKFLSLPLLCLQRLIC